jgi:hypothetical protein
VLSRRVMLRLFKLKCVTVLGRKSTLPFELSIAQKNTGMAGTLLGTAD